MSNEIRNNPDLGRYEILVDGEPAGFAEYRLGSGGTVVFTHTEVNSKYEGQGVGSDLASGALDDVRAKGGSVRPLCPFIKRYIDRHPEYKDLVA